MVEKILNSFRGLRLTFLVTYLCVGLVPLLFFVTSVFETIDNYFIEDRKKILLNDANVISGNVASSNYMYDKTKEGEFAYSVKDASEQGGYRVIVIDSSGIVVNDSNNSDAGKTFLIPEVIEALNAKDVANKQLQENTVYAAATIFNADSEIIGVVFIADDTSDITETLLDIKTQIYVLMSVVMIIVVFIVSVISLYFTEPLKNVLIVIKEMSEGHLDKRVPVINYHNEVTDLVIACNNMADKLETVETTRQIFVSNVSHELKTPLSAIKVLSESILLQGEVPQEMYVEFLKDINSEVDRMTDIINDLLTLVKLDQKEIPISFEVTDLNKMGKDIIKRLTPLAELKGIEVKFNEIKEVSVDMDSMKFTLAISNLIENAIKYTEDGGLVTVTVDCDHQNAFFTVTDTGVGIADEEIPKIFERFYRVDKTRDRGTGGSGLGLSITHSTVLLHKGSIKVTSKEDEGTTFVVRFPLKQVVLPDK